MSSKVVRSPQAEVIRFKNWEAARRPSPEPDAQPVEAETEPVPQDESPTPTGEELSRLEREAYREGYEAGERSGMEMADRKIQSMLERFAASLEELGRLRLTILRETERELVRLALEIAKKLVHREIRIDPEIIVTLVRVALGKLKVNSPVVVRLNARDHGLLEPLLEELTGGGSDTQVSLKVAPELNRGDCRIESDFGTVEGRIDEQFREIEKGLLGQF